MADGPSQSLAKYDVFRKTVRFRSNRRRGRSLLKFLRKCLRSNRSMQLVQQVRDRIYLKCCQRSDDKTGHAMMFCGVQGLEGTTTLSLLMALLLGELGRNRVLFIGGRFEEQEIEIYEELFGLAKYPVDPIRFPNIDCLRARDRNLSFLSSTPGMEPLELFTHPDFGHFLEDLKGSFDCVIFDMPPFLKASETRLLTPLVDSLFLVCVPGKTYIQELLRCKKSVDEFGGKIDGVLLNRQRIPFWAKFVGQDAFL